MKVKISDVTPNCPKKEVNKEGYYSKYMKYKNKYMELKKNM